MSVPRELNMNVLLLVIFLCFSFGSSESDKVIGKKCMLKNKMPGICTRSYKCGSTLKEWYQGIMPEICSFTGSKPIVCCPIFELPKVPKSIMKCAEYGAAMPEIRRLQKRNLSGGSRARPQQFSHMAALGYLNSMSVIFKCGGSLISDRFVLTVAHCLQDRTYGYVQFVRLGDLDLNSDDDFSKPSTYRVESRIGHPGFMSNMKYNDIALIKLDKRVEFSRHIHPACLYTQPQFPGSSLTALAWGSHMKTDDKSNSLMSVDLDVFPDGKCSGTYVAQRTLNVGIVSDSQFCAGGIREPKDTCQGASGGPLVYRSKYHEDLYNIVGLTSFGISGCGSIGRPGVYTKVSHYIPWIESVVWPDKPLVD